MEYQKNNGKGAGKLRKTHPNLFLGFLVFGIWAIALGVTIIFNVHTKIHLFTGVLFILSGVAQLVGIQFYMPIARFGMIIAIVLGMYVGVMIFLGNWEKIIGVQIIMWVGFSIVQFAPLSEPSVNPTTRK